VSIADILGRDRRPLIAAARHEAIWRVRRVTGWSLPRLGRFFNRDHTTVLHSVREMEKRLAHGPELRGLHDRLVITADNRRSHSLNSSRFLFAPSSLSLRSEGERDGYR
jgi:hypothetical protein